LQVLLVDHQVVRVGLGVTGELGGGVGRGVVQGDGDGGAGDRLGPGGLLQGAEFRVLGLGAAVVALGERLDLLAQRAVGLVQLAG
jgi:hypothetical protein